MRRKNTGLLTVLLVLVVAGLLGLVISRSLHQRPDTEETPEMGEQPEETLEARLLVAGDMVIHDGLNSEAKTDSGYDYTPIFAGAAPYIRRADLAVGTLETTFSDTAQFTGYPVFKSPVELAANLRSLGFDLINTASNHCMDGYNGGLVRTIDKLEENGLAHVGTYRSEEERNLNSGITVMDADGIHIAFLSYSYGTNGIPVDRPYAVNLIYRDNDPDAGIDYDRIKADMEAARELDVDLIAVFMHWGKEYQTEPNGEQNELADFLFAQGADLILGGHTHVPQPMELRRVTGPDGKEKTGYICYCLGNLVSCQYDVNTNLTAVVNIDLEKDRASGETCIKSVHYVPMYMMNLHDYDVTDAGWKYRLLDLHKELTAYESGRSEYLTEDMYEDMLAGLGVIHSIMGEEFDIAYAQQAGDEPV
ncbi:MAG: CapA family protein [Oscillospiraceae bacterium]|nr:CapA family protein [Oscillospiraceae bacterium]